MSEKPGGMPSLLAGRLSSLLWLVPLAFLAVFFLYPLGKIFGMAGQAALQPLAQAQNGWQAAGRPLGFTIYQAALSTLLTLLAGLPAAYLFGRFDFPGRKLLRVLTTLPFILPTVVVAAGFNALLGPRGWVNLGLDGLAAVGPAAGGQFLNTFGAILRRTSSTTYRW